MSDNKDILSKPIDKNDNSEVEMSNEEQKFGAMHPWKTVLMLCIGPVIYGISPPFHEATEMAMVKSVYGQRGVTIAGLSSFIRAIIVLFAILPSTPVAVKVSGYLAEKRHKDAAQIIVDLTRFGLILSLFIAILSYFQVEVLLKFVGTPNDLLRESGHFLQPTLFLLFPLSIFQIMTQALMGEGRSTLYALIQVGSMLFALFIVDPLFLFVFKLPLWTLGISYSSGQIIATIILLYLFYNGKFSVKPEFNMFFKSFSPDFKSSLFITLPFLFFYLAGMFPPMIMINKAMQAGKNVGPEMENMLAAIIPAGAKVYSFFVSMSVGFSQGIPPSVSYAFQSKRYGRAFSLYLWALVLPICLFICVSLYLTNYPRSIMKIWLSDIAALDYAEKAIPNLFYTTALLPISDATTMFLIGINKSAFALINPIVRAIAIIWAAISLYNINTHNPSNILKCVIIQDLSSLVSSLGIAFFSFKFIQNLIQSTEKPIQL